MTTSLAPAQPIALVVSDIDGTLVNRAKELTPRARAAIEALKARGIGFTVTSARPPVGLRSIVERLGIAVAVSAVNGGAIIRPDLSIIEEKLLSPEASALAVKLLRENGIDAWLFTNDAWYIRDPSWDHVEHETRTIGQAPTVVEDFEPGLLSRCLKIVGACNDHAHLAAVEGIVQAALAGTALATRSQAYYLDVTHPKANKGEGVLSLAQALGIPPQAVMTIGDGANDVPMFAKSGFSVAMGNATEAVKSQALAVTDDCEHDGFAKAIERFVLASASHLDAAEDAWSPDMEA